jgi:alpha-amylase
MKQKITTFWVRTLLLLIVFTATIQFSVNAQQRVKKVIFQAFWWDYWNENYRFGWANYLTELAPRLKAAGFNAIWIPPAMKQANPDFVGYMPFDNYDLGDKRQKGNGHPLNDRMRTRVGTKDDLLRMIAVMHANGIEVIHDVVLNHNGDAGGGVNTFGAPAPVGSAGAGGQDPASGSTGTASGFKNFRYVSYSSPALDEFQNDYWTRSGRWAKNYQNFYNCTSGCNDINSMFWGPDINYDASAIGQSSNIPTSGSTVISGVTRNYYNPVQPNNYMQDNAKDWLLWLKKQTGSDGWRWDAVKHFSLATQETSIWHSKYNPSLSALQAGGQDMFCVGEWIGDQFQLDTYANNIASPTTPGGVTNEKHTGTFDFGLRGYNTSGNGGLFQLVRGNGSFNMQNLPSEQQGFRFFDYPGGLRVHRSVNFVNSHDTYRPVLQSNGNFAQPLGVNGNTGWNTGSELGGNGQHLDPREPRLFAAYAAAFAMDGNPLVFFEDLFDIGTTGKRYSHLPQSTTDLPARGDIINLMQAHQRLAFKDGDYGVPTASNSPFYQSGSAADHLVLERVGKAIIGITDAFNSTANNSADQLVYCKVNDAWPVGTILYDYSGAHGISTVTIPADRRVLIQTAPVGHTISNAFGHGYSIWAPVPTGVIVTSVNDLYNYLATYNQPRATTTQQEWEMADDLPTNNTNQRVAGKIYVAAGQPITYFVKPEVNGTNITVALWDLDGNKLHEISGVTSTSSPLTGTYSTNYSGWVVIKVRNTTNTQAGQKCWVNVTYTAPTVVDTRATINAFATRAAIWTGNKGTNIPTDCGNWEEGRMPGAGIDLIIPAYSTPSPQFTSSLTVKNLTVMPGATLNMSLSEELNITGNINSVGFINARAVCNGTSLQSIIGGGTFTGLKIANSNHVQLVNGSILIGNLLDLSSVGNLILQDNNVTINSGSGSIGGASSASYIQTANTTSTGGSLIRNVSSTAVSFPVGNTNFTPVTLTNTGTATNFSVRAFESVLQNGTSGTAMSTTGLLNKTWLITPTTTTGLNVTASFSWNAIDEGNTFNRNSAAVGRNPIDASNTWFRVSANAAATGTNPYSLTATGITLFSAFSLFSANNVLPVTFLDFSGELKGKQVQLKWTTGAEINNKGFNVERSLNGTDFTAIAFVSAANTSSAVHNYQFVDEVKGKRIYYRLQQVDNDGKATYSNVVVINNNSSIQLVQVVPNPVKNTFDLIAGASVTAATKVQIDIHTTTGVLVKSINGSFDVVRNAVKNSLSNQPAGMYFFTIQSDGDIQRIKVLKQ